MKSPCLDCGLPTIGAHCVRCKKPRNRPTTAARGYGSPHQQAREWLKRTLPTYCGCGLLITAADPWHAAHNVDGNPDFGYHVACPKCNQREKRRG